MLRRVHTPRLSPGKIVLDVQTSRHVRDVLRLADGSTIEVFDNAGKVAEGTILRVRPEVTVLVDPDAIRTTELGRRLTVASAVPKGDRADWMIEKLSEIGCARFVPLQCERSVVLPRGQGKSDRWRRIATESARQSRRSGVMQIDELTPVGDMLGESDHVLHLSTQTDAKPLQGCLHPFPFGLMLLIGPEGGWSEGEIEMFAARGVVGVRLTETVLRVETAAVVAAGIVLSAGIDAQAFNPTDPA